MKVLEGTSFSPTEILEALRYIIEYIEEMMREDPEYALAKVSLPSKDALRIDIDAENEFREMMRRMYPEVEVHGEEETQDPTADLEALDLSDRTHICALVDMVDGTDLLERGLHNWCSSAVFFQPNAPRGERILASFIALPTKEIYFSTRETPNEVRVQFARKRSRPAAGHSLVTSLNDASLCFYGQKVLNLREFGTRQLIRNRKHYPNQRIYNLAGMPMIVKMLDKRVTSCRGIDAVIETKGQKPHDIVPGAYLAMHAGCTLLNLKTGTNMTKVDLEDALLRPFHPTSNMQYVIASTPQLADRIQSQLSVPFWYRFQGALGRLFRTG